MTTVTCSKCGKQIGKLGIASHHQKHKRDNIKAGLQRLSDKILSDIAGEPVENGRIKRLQKTLNKEE
jgi:hypothetical protein